MGRVVMYPENLDQIDGTELLGDLGREIADDATAFAPELTGRLKEGIHVTDLTRDSVTVEAQAHHPDEPSSEGEYAYWVEVGTSDTPASRFLERALYRRRG